MNTNFEGILPVGFPIDAPWDERFKGVGCISSQVSVPGANRRWVRVNLPNDADVIEATTWDEGHTGMPCRYLAVPTYYKGIISWAATPFRPGVPNHLDAGEFLINGERKRVALCTYTTRTKLTGIKTYANNQGESETWAVTTARITVSKLNTYDNDGELFDLYVLPTVCNDGLIVKRRILSNPVVYQQVSHIDDGDELPLALDYSPQNILICKLTDREMRANDCLETFGMLFSLNVSLHRLNSNTAALAPAVFSNAILQLADDTAGHFDTVNVVIQELPITIQAEAGATTPASAPGAGADLSGVEAKLSSIDLDLTNLTTMSAKLQSINDSIQSNGVASRATFSGHMAVVESNIAAISSAIETSLSSLVSAQTASPSPAPAVRTSTRYQY